MSAGLPGAIDLPPPTVEGYVDSVTRQGASGWAWVPSFPGAAVQVEAVLKGRVIGRATAGQMRPDLLEHGVGTGRYGFELFFEETIIGDEAPMFQVLAPSSQNLPCLTALPTLTPADVASRPRGSIATWSREHAEFTSSGPEFEEFDPTILANSRNKL